MPTARDDFHTRIPERLRALGPAADKGGTEIVFRIRGTGGGTWTVRLGDPARVEEGAAVDPDCVLDMDEDAWGTISTDPREALRLYFNSRIQVSGNPMHAMNIQALLSDEPDEA